MRHTNLPLLLVALSIHLASAVGNQSFAQEPFAWSDSWNFCLHSFLGQHCISPEGRTTCTPGAASVCVNRPWPGEDRPNTISTQVGGVLPVGPGVGIAGSVSQDLNNGNRQGSVGPFVGIPNVAGVSWERTRTYDAQRAQQLRDAMALGAEMERNRLIQERENYYRQQLQNWLDQQARLAAEAEMRRSAALYAYNPPAEFVDPAQAAAPATPPSDSSAIGPAGSQRFDDAQPATTQFGYDEGRARTAAEPVPGAAPSGDRGQQQFRAEVEEAMRRFQAEADERERFLRSRENLPAAPDSSPAGGSSAPRSEQPQSTPAPVDVHPAAPQEYAPRNGYDAFGNRPDSPRRQYDAQGYYVNRGNRPAPVRQNRRYSIDGQSWAIGRGPTYAGETSQPQSAARPGSAESWGGATSTPAPASTPQNLFSPNAISNDAAAQPAAAPRIGFDDSRPRTRFGYDESLPRTPAGPSVAPRQPGAQSQTASLRN